MVNLIMFLERVEWNILRACFDWIFQNKPFPFFVYQGYYSQIHLSLEQLVYRGRNSSIIPA